MLRYCTHIDQEVLSSCRPGIMGVVKPICLLTTDWSPLYPVTGGRNLVVPALPSGGWYSRPRIETGLAVSLTVEASSRQSRLLLLRAIKYKLSPAANSFSPQEIVAAHGRR